jgi:hypothetical protein
MDAAVANVVVIAELDRRPPNAAHAALARELRLPEPRAKEQRLRFIGAGRYT